MKSPQEDINARVQEIDLLMRSLRALTTAAIFAGLMVLAFVIGHVVLSLGLGLSGMLSTARDLAAM